MSSFSITAANTMVDLEERRVKRLRLLNKFYEVSEGDQTRPVRVEFEIIQALGWKHNETASIMQYLKSEGLIFFRNPFGTATITHKGVKAIENAWDAPDEPTERFPAINNYINIGGDVNNSQFQQASSKSSQHLKVTPSTTKVISETLSEIKQQIGTWDIDDAVKNDLSIDIETVETQLKRTVPIRSVVFSSLQSVREILKGIAEKAAGTALAAQLPHWISKLSEHLHHLS